MYCQDILNYCRRDVIGRKQHEAFAAILFNIWEIINKVEQSYTYFKQKMQEVKTKEYYARSR